LVHLRGWGSTRLTHALAHSKANNHGGSDAFVEGKLRLKVNREKCAVARPWKRKFLGFSFTMQKQATIRLAAKTIDRFKDKVLEITSRTRSMSTEERISWLNRYLLGGSVIFG